MKLSGQVRKMKVESEVPIQYFLDLNKEPHSLNSFIGSNLIRLLLKQNYFVINIDKISYSSNFYNTVEYKKNINYKFGLIKIKENDLFK